MVYDRQYPSAVGEIGWGEGRSQETARALELADKAIAIDPTYPGPYNLLALVSLHRRQYDEAISYGEKAIALEPNNNVYLSILGRNLVLAGRPEEGLPLIQQGNRRTPFTNALFTRFEGEAYHALGRYEEALAAFERARARDPQGPPAMVWLAMTYADMGRMEEARAAAQEVLKLDPKFSVKRFVNALPYKDRTETESRLATLRQLGLPE